MSDILDRPFKLKESVVRSSFLSSMEKMGFFTQAIESPGTGVGIPDAFINKGSRAAWIEFKAVPEQNTKKGIVPGWQDGQMGWALNYKESGGRWFLVIAVGKKIFYAKVVKDRYSADELFDIKEIYKEEF
jgi:hypothetical protein